MTDYQQSTYALSRLADCGDPDRPDSNSHERPCNGDGYGGGCTDCDGSPGARFLRCVEDSTREVWERAVEDNCTADADGNHLHPDDHDYRTCAKCAGAVSMLDGWAHDRAEDDDHPVTLDAISCPVHDGIWAETIRDVVQDEIHEVADGAPNIYTSARWAEFTDLAAYQEEPEITGEWPEDLTQAAGYALYQIAERLAWALLVEWAEELDAEADERADAVTP